MDAKSPVPETEVERVPADAGPSGRAQRKQGKRSLGWVQLNVQIPEELRTQVKIKALQEGTDMSDVVTELLRTWIRSS
jgi:hypothetical protein